MLNQYLQSELFNAQSVSARRLTPLPNVLPFPGRTKLTNHFSWLISWTRLLHHRPWRYFWLSRKTIYLNLLTLSCSIDL